MDTMSTAMLAMAPELGQVALLLALAAALVQGTVPLAGAARGEALWMALGRSAAWAQALAVLMALALLTASFVGHDFSVLYVASNSNRSLPLAYRLAGVWGGHEGSLLLWVAMLSVWTVAVVLRSAHLPPAMTARILAVMGLISVGFLLFMLTTSNPFERLIPAPADGRDLNPLLQDPGMVFHPPMLYMGYVGFSVAFAFAVAALIGGELDARWARWTRPWTTAAWCFLTIGIALGSAWAYYELGWGGWWFWDPVENASFMPWLLGTALIHSLAVTEKRGAFKSWTVLLAILAFSLSLLGTFLVRSGVLSSVHAFATDPRRGLFILGFLVVVTGSSLLLYAWRAPRIGLGARFGAASRESMLLANNVVLAAATGTVLLGTLYPLLLDALDLGKLSVGPPYFETVFVPLMTVLLLLAGVGPLVRWRGAALGEVLRPLRRPVLLMALGSLAGAVGLSAWAGGVRPGPVLGLFLALWVLGGVLADLRPWVAARRWVPRATLGMMLAHLGVAAFAVGVTMVRSYEIESDQRFAPGQTVVLQDLSFRFMGVRDLVGPNYEGLQAEVEVRQGERLVAVLHPEKRVYRVQRNPMTEAAIQPGFTRDLYVSLGEEVAPDVWTLRLYIKPFVDWIWGGCLLMALGGALAASDRRYRRPAARVQPAAPPESAVPGMPAEPGAPGAPTSVRPGWTWAIAGLVLVGALTGAVPLSAQAQTPTQAQAAAPSDGDSLESPEIEARLRRITAELRCLVCQNQTIADSHAGLAIDLKREVRAMLRQGASDQAVRDYMTQRYGDFVLYRPPLQPTTWLLWAGPALLLAAGATALVLSLRRRARLPPERFEPDLGMDPDADADPDASPEPSPRTGVPA